MKTQDRTHKDCPTSYIVEVADFPDKDGMIHARFACPEHGVWWEEAWFERKQPEKQEMNLPQDHKEEIVNISGADYKVLNGYLVALEKQEIEKLKKFLVFSNDSTELCIVKQNRDKLNEVIDVVNKLLKE